MYRDAFLGRMTLALLQVKSSRKGQNKVEKRYICAASLLSCLLTVGPIIRLNCFYYIFAFRLLPQLSCKHRVSLFYLYSQPTLRIKAKVNTILLVTQPVSYTAQRLHYVHW
jgi:hypothetical protein